MIKGSHHLEVSKEKLRIAHLGKKQSEEHKLNRVKSRIGYRHSEATKQKMKEARLRNPIIHFGDSNPSKRLDVKLKISLKQKGIKETPEAIAKTHAWHKDKIKRQLANERLKISHLGKVLSEEQKRKIGNASKLQWQNLEYKEKNIKNFFKMLKKRPTNLELQFTNLIKTNNLPYKYTGDYSFLIGYKNPDFININGEKICIEVRAKNVCNYLQKITPEEYKIKQIEHYKKFGWKCLVFFDNKDKLNEREILEVLNGDLS